MLWEFRLCRNHAVQIASSGQNSIIFLNRERCEGLFLTGTQLLEKKFMRILKMLSAQNEGFLRSRILEYSFFITTF